MSDSHHSSGLTLLLERTSARDLFLRLFGLIFAIAFLSLYSQVVVLFGADGLMPAAFVLARGEPDWLALPTVFWLDWSDASLRAASLAGAVLSLGLVFNLAPRYCLLACWLLYLSFVSIGPPFLSFQWDNLLLETGLCALLVAPGGLRPRHAPGPHPAAVLVMQWLLFRLHFESGVAKLASGDPTWRDLTAMVSYYETAPLPTWIGWYVHQLPVWAHQATSALTLIVEIVVVWLIWSPRRVRLVAFWIMVAMQVVVVLTANYTFFNYLTMVLCLFMLDDRQLAPLMVRLRLDRRPAVGDGSPSWRGVVFVPVAAFLILISCLPFLRYLGMLPPALAPVQNVVDTFRIANAYHLFAGMTLVRREAVIEGSDDGQTWQEYEFHYKPGDVRRAPAFVAPHQPRVDFRMWFLLLGQRWGAPYFDRLLQRLLTNPESVASLFAHMPYKLMPPKYVRAAVYRYRFTDFAAGQSTGAWWQRELILHSDPQTRR